MSCLKDPSAFQISGPHLPSLRPMLEVSVLNTSPRGMLHDPVAYPNPSLFKPERFIAGLDTTTEPDPREIAFGFGRR